MRRALTMTVIVATTLSAATVGATAGETIFERLHVLDASATNARAESGNMREQVVAIDALLEDGWEAVDVALRAARPIRNDVSQRFARWLSAYRAADREAIDAPFAKADTYRLLRYSSKKALSAGLRDVDVIRRADGERKSFTDLMSRRARMAVEVARTDSMAQASLGAREAVLDEARAGGAAADLDATDAEFAEKLRALPEAAPDFDFHRFKGTLARPIPTTPEYHFGARAPLMRPGGWTYRPEAGDDVHAIHAGEVVFVGAVEGWGLVVVIDHGGGYRSAYGHLGAASTQVGDRVERADVVASAGDSGSLDGTRLYFELQRHGDPIDPAPWFLRQ